MTRPIPTWGNIGYDLEDSNRNPGNWHKLMKKLVIRAERHHRKAEPALNAEEWEDTEDDWADHPAWLRYAEEVDWFTYQMQHHVDTRDARTEATWDSLFRSAAEQAQIRRETAVWDALCHEIAV